MKCLFHTFVVLFIFSPPVHSHKFTLASHMIVSFPMLQWGLTLSPFELLHAHFSYLLARAVIGLQLGQDPVSLLQHSANLVPHSRLCLRGLGIWEGRKEG